jgi:glucokinase
MHSLFEYFATMSLFEAADLAPLQSWKKTDVLLLCAGIDVGGSGLRIHLSNFVDASEFVDLPHVKAQSTADTLAIIADLTAAIDSVAPGFVTKGTALAVAGPISNGRVLLTNWSGDPSLRTIAVSELPPRLFPPNATSLLNDLEAGAYGVLSVGEKGGLDPLFTQLWTDRAPAGPILSTTRTAVLAMGSGYGVALIVKSPLLAQPLVLGTELGHLQVTAQLASDPAFAAERELLQFVSDHHYAGVHMPEYEDIASGRGLRLAYQYFVKKSTGELLPLESLDAGAIAQKAQEGDPLAEEALLWHQKLFIRSAKTIATSLCCDSIVLALDNQVKNAWFVFKISDKLKEEFYSWIRPPWLDGVRVYTQTKILNFNILGTDYIAHRLADKA